MKQSLRPAPCLSDGGIGAGTSVADAVPQINHAGEGGLYAEMVADRSFDGIAHAMGFDPAAPITQPGEAALEWGGAELQEVPQSVLAGGSAPDTG